MKMPRLAAAALLSLVCALAGAASAQSGDPLFEVVTTGTTNPIYVADPGDGRIFIVERAGYIRIFSGGTLQPRDATAFLDIHSQVNQAGEGGLTSMAFAPDFETSGTKYVYVMYTRTGSGGSPLESVVARYTVGADPTRLDPGSAKELLVQPSPVGPTFTNHKGGQLQIGPDDMLYIGFGDGGDANDPGCRSQTRNVFFGKLLRIDPTGTGHGVGGVGYGIPAGNPFASDPNWAPEIWALGLRNPWRYSFDRETHDLWIADVGQDAREEVDLEQSGSAGGKNYGWNVEEGKIDGPGPNGNCPAYVPPRGSASFTAPIFDYKHTGGSSITGGYVYRGSAKEWRGRYIYADFITGSIRYLKKNGTQWQATLLFQGDAFQPASFGEGSDGELYLAFLGQGIVYKLRFDRIGSNKNATACVSKLNEGFARLADTESKLIGACVAKAAKGKLDPSDIDVCAGEDPKIGKLEARNAAIDAKQCQEPPSLGYAGSEAGNAAAAAADFAHAQDVFGDDLGAAVAQKTENKNMAGCQKAVLAGMSACQKARRAEFVRCKKLGLKKGFDENGLPGCLTLDPKNKVAKLCDGASGKLVTKTIDKSCSARDVDLAAAFPGCDTADAGALAQCIDASGECQSCRMFRDADNLPAGVCDDVCPAP